MWFRVTKARFSAQELPKTERQREKSWGGREEMWEKKRMMEEKRKRASGRLPIEDTRAGLRRPATETPIRLNQQRCLWQRCGQWTPQKGWREGNKDAVRVTRSSTLDEFHCLRVSFFCYFLADRVRSQAADPSLVCLLAVDFATWHRSAWWTPLDSDPL